jgi:MraZ protein
VSLISLDEKGRLAIPTRYRGELLTTCSGQVIVTVGLDKCLLLYPLPEFEEIERKLVKLPSLNPHAKRLQRLLMGHATECELDGQGRLLVAESLRHYAGLERKVALVGQGNKFEIWDEVLWNSNRDIWVEEERLGQEDLTAELEGLAL